MTRHPDLDARAAKVIDTNKYMVLGTADADGLPWTTPVFFTPERYTRFYWVSSPDARHSRNIAARPDISIVVFDSQVPIGGAQAAYMRARAELVPDDDLDRAAGFYSGRLPELKRFGREQLEGDTLFRLYCAVVSEHFVLVGGSDPTYGRGVDDRMTVTLPPTDA